MKKNLTVGDDEKKVVKEWFEELRNIICEEFEKIEMLYLYLFFSYTFSSNNIIIKMKYKIYQRRNRYK